MEANFSSLWDWLISTILSVFFPINNEDNQDILRNAEKAEPETYSKLY